MRKKFKDLKVGDTVYVFTDGDVILKEVTHICSCKNGDGSVTMDIDGHPYFVNPNGEINTLSNGDMYSNKESLVELLCKMRDTLNEYIEKYS